MAIRKDSSGDGTIDLVEVVAEISVSFAGLTPEGLDGAITRALERIGTHVGADRSYIFLIDAGRGTMSNTHEWCAEGISPERENLQDIPLEDFPQFLDSLEQSNVREIPRVADLPDSEEGLREAFEAQGIQSLILVALRDRKGRLIGFSGFDAVRSVRPWQPDHIHLLQVTCDLIGAALERRSLWRRLERSEAHNRALLEALPDTLVVFSPRGRVLDLLVGKDDPYPELTAELRRKDLHEFLGPDMVPVLEDVTGRLRAGESPAVALFRLERNGHEMAFEVRVTPYGKEDFLALVRDVTQRETDERALRSLALQLEQAEEAQRRRLAQLLHDNIGQDLTGMHFQLQSCLQDNVAERDRIQIIIDLLHDTMHKTQDLTFDLSPPMLYELGLSAALQALARKFERNHGIRCRFLLKGGDLPPGASGGVLLFRIAGELLTNSLKHSGCENIEIGFSCDDREVRLTVADDGQGMAQPEHTAEGREQGGGFGLFSIRQRLEPLGGTMRIHEGRGARITIHLPRE